MKKDKGKTKLSQTVFGIVPTSKSCYIILNAIEKINK